MPLIMEWLEYRWKWLQKYGQITLNLRIVHFTYFELEIFFGHLTLKAIKQARALDRQITHRIKLVKSVPCREPWCTNLEPTQPGNGSISPDSQPRGGVVKKRKDKRINSHTSFQSKASYVAATHGFPWSRARRRTSHQGRHSGRSTLILAHVQGNQ